MDDYYFYGISRVATTVSPLSSSLTLEEFDPGVTSIRPGRGEVLQSLPFDEI